MCPQNYDRIPLLTSNGALTSRIHLTQERIRQTMKLKIIAYISILLLLIVQNATLAAANNGNDKMAKDKKLDKKIMGYAKELRSTKILGTQYLIN